MTHLHLGECKLGPRAVHAIASCLAGNELPMLQCLNLRNNNIGAVGAKSLAEALKGNSAMITINLDGFALPVKQLKGTEPVASLDFSSKRLGVASAIVIAKLIEFNSVEQPQHLLQPSRPSGCQGDGGDAEV